MRQHVAKAAAALVLSAAGALALIGWEGSEPIVYLDPVGIPTTCVGHTADLTSADVGKDFAPLCAQLLAEDTSAAQSAVRRLVQAAITQAQFDALVSFTFNVGEGNLRGSTLLRKINNGDCLGAGAEFPKWVYARGKKLAGLVARRAGERRTWESGCPT